jgi:hypothetical protein
VKPRFVGLVTALLSRERWLRSQWGGHSATKPSFDWAGWPSSTPSGSQVLSQELATWHDRNEFDVENKRASGWDVAL